VAATLMVGRNARSPMLDNQEGSKAEATAGSGIRNLETAATRLLQSPSGRHSQGNQSRAGMLRCPGVRSVANRRGIPRPHGIQRLGDRGEQDSPRRLRIHSSVQDKRGIPHPKEPDERGIPRRRGIRRPGVQPQQDIKAEGPTHCSLADEPKLCHSSGEEAAELLQKPRKRRLVL
jgi:hypothetical protein